jgi:diguanylate cyclase (GGDEF)-like protein/PAS domain S-box-containing protein
LARTPKGEKPKRYSRADDSESTRLRRELDRCRAELAELAERELGHRRFIENLTGGYFFYRHDAQRHYLYLSPSVRQVLGYSPEEYIASYAALFSDHPMNLDARGRTERAIAGEPQYSFEAELLAKDGSRHVLEVSEVPVLGADGRVELIEGIAHDVTEKRRMEERLLELATHDELTGLLNRRHLRTRLEQTMNLVGRRRFGLALALIDLDGLKAVNDTHGHAGGDRMIRAAADVLQHELRKSDIVGRRESVAGRLGGDEFAAILPYAGDREATIAMERVLAAFAATVVEVAPGVTCGLRASVGVATWQPSESVEELQARADAALYRAKREGRGRITVWSTESS